MKYTTVRAALGTVVLMLLLQANPPVLRAQTPTGNILGTVHDSGGGVIPGVNISAKSLETGAVRSAATDSSGAYQILNLSAGFYDIEAGNKGFKTQVQKGVAVSVGATVTVNFTLAVGEVQERVEVTSSPQELNTTDASMGGLVGETAIRELPLNGRDWLQLATLQAGVAGGIGQQSAATSTNSRAARGNGVALVISGNRPTGNVFLVDGLVVNDFANASPGSGLNINLGVEAVREFRVLTSEYTAQYGRSTGGVVTAVFKSGTNEFHGGVYEFLRNDVLDAANFFSNQGGLPKPPLRRNQFGASAGGPIKKGKTFIFGDYEGFREVRGVPHTPSTLSPNALNGSIVPIAKSVAPYLGFFPPANGQISKDGLSGIFNFTGKRVGNEDYTVIKLDQNFSDRTTLSGSFQFDNTAEDQPDPFNLKLTGSPSRHFNTILSLQHIFSATLLNTARMGVSRSHITDSLDVTAINPIAADTSLGFLTGLPAGTLGVTGLDTNLGGLGGSGADILNYTSFQWGDDLSWIRGKNTFKFGGYVERLRYNKNSLVGAPLGEWDFDTVALFLQGIPSQFSADIPGKIDIRGLRQTYEGLYFQDEIAARSNLHINIGLRYEHVSPVTEQNGLVAVLPTLDSPTARTGGAYYNTNTLNFAPRLGVSWDPTGGGKTILRAGFGIYDVLPFPYLMENRTNSAPFFLQGTTPSNSPPPADSFPKGGLDLIPKTGTSLRASFVEQDPHRAYNQAWNLTVQRQLTANSAITVGYVGAHAVHLPRSIEDANEVPFSMVTTSSDGHLLFPTDPTKKNGGPIQRINPNFARIATTVWDDSSTYHSLVVDFNKRFSRGFFFKAAYTWSKSIDFGSNTFSDNENINTSGNAYAFFIPIQKGPSDFDISHRLVLNYSWSLPTPGSLTGVSRALLGGWVLGGILTVQTGPPFSVVLSNDQARTGDSRTKSSSGGQRPNFNNIPGCTPNAVNPGNPDNYIKLECFSYPTLGQLGNLGRNTLRGPGLQDFDFSVFKNWPVWRERLNLQFRTEIFNIFNKPNFQMPKTQIFNGKGGFISTAPRIPAPTLTDGREIQFGLKLTW
jgi:hypothetical protein